jgi:hypothetical protein
MKMGPGLGTKKYAEPMSLKILLLFVREKGVKSIHIFGDSLNVINWVQKTQKCHNIQLITLLEEIFIFLGAFDMVCVRHVYRELNMDVDSLYKEGLQLGLGQWIIIEDPPGNKYEYYHQPSIDP